MSQLGKYTNKTKEDLILEVKSYTARTDTLENCLYLTAFKDYKTCNLEHLDRLVYSLRFFDNMLLVSGDPRQAKFIEIYKRKGYTFTKVMLRFRLGSVEVFFNNPKYTYLLESLPDSLIAILASFLDKTTYPDIVTEDFIVNLENYTDSNQYNCCSSDLVKNYLDWREIGQEVNELLTKHLVDIPVDYRKYVIYLLNNQVHIEDLKLIKLIHIKILEDLLVEDKNQKLKMEDFLYLLTHAKYALTTVILASYKYTDGINLTEDIMQNQLQRFKSLFDSEVRDTLNENESVKNTLCFVQLIINLYNVDYIQLLEDHSYRLFYNRIFYSTFDFNLIDFCIICSELAREQGLDYENIFISILKQVNTKSLNPSNQLGYSKKENFSVFIEMLPQQLLLGNDLTVYFDLNLDITEIKDMQVTESLLPKDFKFNSLAYKLWLRLKELSE